MTMNSKTKWMTADTVVREWTTQHFTWRNWEKPHKPRTSYSRFFCQEIRNRDLLILNLLVFYGTWCIRIQSCTTYFFPPADKRRSVARIKEQSFQEWIWNRKVSQCACSQNTAMHCINGVPTLRNQTAGAATSLTAPVMVVWSPTTSPRGVTTQKRPQTESSSWNPHIS
jgi:hypothetical protein